MRIYSSLYHYTISLTIFTPPHYYTDEDEKSETIVYSYQVMEKVLISFENKNLQKIYIYIFWKKLFVYFLSYTDENNKFETRV